jgi:hypothetical protein
MLVDNVVLTSLVSNSLNSIEHIIPVTTPPVIESVVLNGDSAIITWTANPGSAYRLQYKDDFNSPKWIDAGKDIVATGSEAQAVDSIVGTGQRFYRIVLLLP